MTRKPSFLIGLIGSAIGASRSPPMHEREADALGLRYLYQLIDLDRLGVGAEALPALLRAAERMGFAGLNITHPCKQAVVPLLDELSEEARAVGSVNTVVLRGGRRVGHNTDGFGFAAGFRRGFADVAKARAVQLGAGGAGVAVAHAALGLGIGELTVFDIVPGRAEQLVRDLTARFGPGRARHTGRLAAALAETDGLIHCTPTGMEGHPGLPLPAELLRPAMWVAEIVYFPLETELLRHARALGCRTLDGAGMAVYQAVEAFRLFTGIAPDPDRMRHHFDTAAPG